MQRSQLISIRHRPVKRLFDICFTLSIFVLFLPVFAVISFLIFLSAPGKKIIFSHERIGRGGKPFKCYKFRTMHHDAEKRLIELLDKSPHLNEEWMQKRKLSNDPRITQIGKFLRKCSLDELPQFWNVIKGDLSVVGPRPVMQEEIDLYFGEKANKILSVRPGITGVWQVSGRSDISYDKRIELDEVYVDCNSLWFDIVLILKTIPCLFSSKGAY